MKNKMVSSRRKPGSRCSENRFRLYSIPAFAGMTILFFIVTANAQSLTGLSTASSSKDPVEITAEETLEWHRNEKKFIARGAVVVRQGKAQILSETLTADYREGQETSFDVYHLTADRSVVISSEGNKAQGDRAVYDVDTGKAVMTGQDLLLSGEDLTVTAEDRFEYFVPEGRVNALGAARAVRGGDTITAERLSAVFKEGVDGKRALDRLEAEGQVIITTATETVKGDKGLYSASTNKATLTGNVTIIRGESRLTGAQAEIDLSTNISRITGGQKAPDGDGRVRGVFYPEDTPDSSF